LRAAYLSISPSPCPSHQGRGIKRNPLEAIERQGKDRVSLAGLTFIEILFVVLILGILMGFLLPQVRKSASGLQLNNSSRQLCALVNYLHERSIVEEKVIYLGIDSDNNEFWYGIKEEAARSKTYRLPVDMRIESKQKEIIFYPDGSIDKFIVKLISADDQYVELAIKGGYPYVKAGP